MNITNYMGGNMDSVSFVSENIVSGQKLCSFLLPTAWSVPECLKRTSPKEMGAVLDIAANVWERILHGAESVHMKDVLESERLRLVEEWSMKLDVVEKRSVLEKQCRTKSGSWSWESWNDEFQIFRGNSLVARRPVAFFGNNMKG